MSHILIVLSLEPPALARNLPSGEYEMNITEQACPSKVFKQTPEFVSHIIQV